MLMRFHTQTAGVSLTAQQPLLNIVRTAIEALAGVLGGTQSLHTNSFDEALALPTEEAVRVALRTQQVIAHETGVTNTADPLGGAYFIEKLTDEMEARRLRVLRPDRRARRHGRRDRDAASRSARSRTPPSRTSRRSSRASARSSASTTTCSRASVDRRSTAPTPRRRSARRRASKATRAARDGAAAEAALAALVQRRGGRAEPDAAHHRLRPRARLARARWSRRSRSVFGTYTEHPQF